MTPTGLDTCGDTLYSSFTTAVRRRDLSSCLLNGRRRPEKFLFITVQAIITDGTHEINRKLSQTCVTRQNLYK